MSKVELSPYLSLIKEDLVLLKNRLQEKYSYVSILAVDSRGKKYSCQRNSTDFSDSPFAEKGFVIRVYNGKGYSEHSFNYFNKNLISNIISEIDICAEKDLNRIKDEGINTINYPVINEEKIEKEFIDEVKILPEEIDTGTKLKRLQKLVKSGMKRSDILVDFRAIYEEYHLSKIFISNNKNLSQSYIWSNAYLLGIGRKGNNTQYSFEPFSGLKGAELLDEMESKIDKVIETVKLLLSAEPPEPGEYEIICNPALSGLIAHEAFGHGVEMDMYVKNRAKAAEYMNKAVASEKVGMHDGATAAREVSSYLFDDEGTIGTDTMIIENGILKKGMNDILSAMKLNVEPTGNGKRESFERKAYTRMTNTFFSGGKDKLDDMIKSIKKGYLLEDYSSGMEDPKNWGIQGVASHGREIIDGKLTGKIIAPVIITGYVPDLLKSISMVSEEIELSGTGYCGKGHKEFVKTSTGGPYIKAIGRIG